MSVPEEGQNHTDCGEGSREILVFSQVSGALVVRTIGVRFPHRFFLKNNLRRKTQEENKSQDENKSLQNHQEKYGVRLRNIAFWVF